MLGRAAVALLAGQPSIMGIADRGDEHVAVGVQDHGGGVRAVTFGDDHPVAARLGMFGGGTLEAAHQAARG